MELNFTMLTKPVHFYGPERKGAPQQLIDLEKKVKEADCFVVVSAEYNHSIPPGDAEQFNTQNSDDHNCSCLYLMAHVVFLALANMLDHFPGSAFSYKPSGIVCYSPGIVAD